MFTGVFVNFGVWAQGEDVRYAADVVGVPVR